MKVGDIVKSLSTKQGSLCYYCNVHLELTANTVCNATEGEFQKQAMLSQSLTVTLQLLLVRFTTQFIPFA
jgi:hypothetical protein